MKFFRQSVKFSLTVPLNVSLSPNVFTLYIVIFIWLELNDCFAISVHVQYNNVKLLSRDFRKQSFENLHEHFVKCSKSSSTKFSLSVSSCLYRLVSESI